MHVASKEDDISHLIYYIYQPITYVKYVLSSFTWIWIMTFEEVAQNNRKYFDNFI
jgi:hypothetical protein